MTASDCSRGTDEGVRFASSHRAVTMATPARRKSWPILTPSMATAERVVGTGKLELGGQELCDPAADGVARDSVAVVFSLYSAPC
jgi:hypothetical protein